MQLKMRMWLLVLAALASVVFVATGVASAVTPCPVQGMCLGSDDDGSILSISPSTASTTFEPKVRVEGDLEVGGALFVEGCDGRVTHDLRCKPIAVNRDALYDSFHEEDARASAGIACGGGECMAAWVRYARVGSSTFDRAILMARISDGAVQFSSFVSLNPFVYSAESSDPSTLSAPSIAASSYGFAVTWSGKGFGADADSDVGSLRIARGADVYNVSPKTTVFDDADPTSAATIACSNSDQCINTWATLPSTANQREIMFSISEDSGSTWTAATGLFADMLDTHNYDPFVVALSGGRYFVVWITKDGKCASTPMPGVVVPVLMIAFSAATASPPPNPTDIQQNFLNNYDCVTTVTGGVDYQHPSIAVAEIGSVIHVIVAVFANKASDELQIYHASGPDVDSIGGFTNIFSTAMTTFQYPYTDVAVSPDGFTWVVTTTTLCVVSHGDGGPGDPSSWVVFRDGPLAKGILTIEHNSYDGSWLLGMQTYDLSFAGGDGDFFVWRFHNSTDLLSSLDSFKE